jgi:hypothetical protein
MKVDAVSHKNDFAWKKIYGIKYPCESSGDADPD